MPRDAASRADPQLHAECRAFTRYLTGRDPDGYVVEKYAQLQNAALKDTAPVARIDRVLLGAARAGGMRTRAADAYARIFRPRGLLRRKLVLAFAILENSGAFHGEFTSGGSGSLARALLQIATSSFAFAFALSIGTLVFAPQHLWPLSRVESGIE